MDIIGYRSPKFNMFFLNKIPIIKMCPWTFTSLTRGLLLHTWYFPHHQVLTCGLGCYCTPWLFCINGNIEYANNHMRSKLQNVFFHDLAFPCVYADIKKWGAPDEMNLAVSCGDKSPGLIIAYASRIFSSLYHQVHFFGTYCGLEVSLQQAAPFVCWGINDHVCVTPVSFNRKEFI